MGKATIVPIDNPEKKVKASNCMMSDGQTSAEDAINGVVKVKVKTNISAQVATANSYVSINYDLPDNMTTYLGSIVVVRSINANWAFTTGQVDMHLYNPSMHDIRFTASIAQTYTVDVLTFYI